MQRMAEVELLFIGQLIRYALHQRDTVVLLDQTSSSGGACDTCGMPYGVEMHTGTYKKCWKNIYIKKKHIYEKTLLALVGSLKTEIIYQELWHFMDKFGI